MVRVMDLLLENQILRLICEQIYFSLVHLQKKKKKEGKKKKEKKKEER